MHGCVCCYLQAFQARTMTTLAELQAAANTFKLQYVCDQLYDDDRQQQAQQQAGGTRQEHLPGGPLSRGGSLELAARHQSQNKQQRGSQTEQQQSHVAEQQEQGQLCSGHSEAASIECSPGDSSSSSSSSSTAYRTSWLQQYRALTWRECVKVTRNPADVAGRLLTFTWVALLVGLIYYDLPMDAGSIRQRLNLLFATLCFFVLMPFVNMSL
jgi:hypothetical protein